MLQSACIALMGSKRKVFSSQSLWRKGSTKWSLGDPSASWSHQGHWDVSVNCTLPRAEILLLQYGRDACWCQCSLSQLTAGQASLWLQQRGLVENQRSQNSSVLRVLRPHKAYLCDMMTQRQKQHDQTHWAGHTLRLLAMRMQAWKGLGPTFILRCVTTEIRVIMMGYKLTTDLCTECASLIWKTFLVPHDCTRTMGIIMPGH